MPTARRILGTPNPGNGVSPGGTSVLFGPGPGLTSDLSPGEPGLKEFAKNRLVDRIFKGPNDLVVPTDGVFAENGSGFFPIEDKMVFTGEDAVAHTAFFGNAAVRERIMEWLGE